MRRWRVKKKRDGAEWKRKKQTEAAVNYGCNLRFPRGKERQREKPQVMHIRLCICHIFLSWSVSKLPYNLPSPFVCVYVCLKKRESIYTFTYAELCGAVLRCHAFSELDMMCVYICVEFHCYLAALCCVSWHASTVTWPQHVHGHTVNYKTVLRIVSVD